MSELQSDDEVHSGIDTTVYDLHSHTTASDGLLTPAQLIARAIAMNVNVLAITDHDSVAGLVEAQCAVEQSANAIALINGIEISSLWENHEIHIVGLNVAADHPSLQSFIQEQAQRRYCRAKEIALRLEKSGIPDAFEGVSRLASSENAITRGHFARYLVEIGKTETINQVFKKYLARGKIGYVPPKWCTIEQAIAVIHQAGGVAVLAHPGRYGLSGKWLCRLVEHFSKAGGKAMEIAQCQQPPGEREKLAKLAIEYHLMGSQGSDFHQPCSWIELGRRLWLPSGVVPVWHEW